VPPADSPDRTAGFSPVATLLGEAGPCLSKGPPGSPTEWDFIDSRRCAAYRSAPRFFIAIYRHTCLLLAGADCENFGFFEVLDAVSSDNFESFVTGVLAANPPGFISSLAFPSSNDTYHSVRGQAIEFLADPISRRSGIVSVNGVAQHDLDSWSFAEGGMAHIPGVWTPIRSNGNGYVVISNPRFTSRTLELDFRDYHRPVRTVK
jgi:hypothetical protein